MARLELALELALACGALRLFRVIRPAIDVGCGSALSEWSDDFIEAFASYHLVILVPVVVALIELNFELRPWVKRATRLGIGIASVTLLASYAVLAAAFLR